MFNTKRTCPGIIFVARTLEVQERHAWGIHDFLLLLGLTAQWRGSLTEVVNLCETFEDENFVYMVMELCQGGELAPLND